MSEARANRGTVEIEPPAVPATVMLVDDDPAIRDGVGEFLREEGFAVVSASSGVDALAYLRAGLPVDVILLDVLMPVMDGWDFRAEQLADPTTRDVPVVVITASGFTRETIGRQLKAEDVFAKPLELGAFLQTLKDVCRRGESDAGSSSIGG